MKIDRTPVMPFANVFGGERHALRRQVVRLDVVAHGLAEPGAKAVFVRAARAGRDAVDVAAQVLVGRFGPLQHELRLRARCPSAARTALRARASPPRSATIFLQVVDEAFVVLKHGLGARRLVLEGDLHAAMQVAGDLEPLANHRRIELDLRKDRRDRDGRTRVVPVPRAAPSFFSAADRLALLEPHLPLVAVALDGGDQIARERVDDARADAVQAAGGLVVAASRTFRRRGAR